MIKNIITTKTKYEKQDGKWITIDKVIKPLDKKQVDDIIESTWSYGQKGYNIKRFYEMSKFGFWFSKVTISDRKRHKTTYEFNFKEAFNLRK